MQESLKILFFRQIFQEIVVNTFQRGHAVLQALSRVHEYLCLCCFGLIRMRRLVNTESAQEIQVSVRLTDHLFFLLKPPRGINSADGKMARFIQVTFYPITVKQKLKS